MFWLFLLVFTAIACGWLLGRFAVGASALPGGATAAYRQYFRGLIYLLNDRPDEAIATFVATLEVNKETFDTHLALGNLMRRKGDVEQAIRIHQNLLARPNLPPLQLQRAQLELARDYISAGLYDRAEKILQELVQSSEELRPTCLRHLVEIYQAERDWTKAIETATRLMPRRNLFLSAPDPDPELDGAIAHFHCELAQHALDKNEFDGARAHLIQALIPEMLDTLRTCYDALGRRELFVEYLRGCLAQHASTRLVLAICEEIAHRDGAIAATNFLAEQMRVRPTLRGLLNLISMQRDGARDEGNVEVLQALLQKMDVDKPAYQCNHCGFAGRQIHWLCPSCKQWNTMQPIGGSEGD